MNQAFLDDPKEVVITTTTTTTTTKKKKKTTTEPGATDGMEKRCKLGKNGTNSKSDHRHGSSTSSDNKSSNSKRRATNTNTTSSSSQAASAPESAFAWKLYTVLERATEEKEPQQNRHASSSTPTPTSTSTSSSESASASVSMPLCESISWHGSRAFAIHNPDLFERLVLPDYFHHTEFSDFRAQLALHGFRRIAGGNDHDYHASHSHTYTHDFLIRGTPNLCRLILPVRAYHSKTLSSSKSRSRSSNSNSRSRSRSSSRSTTTKRWSSPSAASSKRSKTSRHRRCRSSFEAALANVESVDFDDRLYSLDDLNVEMTTNDALEVLAALS